MLDNTGARADMAYCLGVLGKTLVAVSQKEEARAKLTQARTILKELRKGSPLTPPQEASLAEIDKMLSTVMRASEALPQSTPAGKNVPVRIF
jgi:hypothetical protein